MKKSVLLGMATFLVSMPALAQTAAGGMTSTAYYALGAGLAIGIAALGGAIGQGLIGAAAMDGISRNPQAKNDVFVPFIIGFVLIESLVIYAFVIAFFLQAKI